MKTAFICTNTFVYRSFWSLISKMQSKFQIPKWRIQNGSQNLQKWSFFVEKLLYTGLWDH